MMIDWWIDWLTWLDLVWICESVPEGILDGFTELLPLFDSCEPGAWKELYEFIANTSAYNTIHHWLIAFVNFSSTSLTPITSCYLLSSSSFPFNLMGFSFVLSPITAILSLLSLFVPSFFHKRYACPLSTSPFYPSTPLTPQCLRKDGVKCGKEVACDPNGERPCCSPWGFCGHTTDHCDCLETITDEGKDLGPCRNFHTMTEKIVKKKGYVTSYIRWVLLTNAGFQCPDWILANWPE